MTLEVNELKNNDYDILENIKSAFYRLWKLKIIVILMTVIGFLTSIIYIGVAGNKTNYYSSATIFSTTYGFLDDYSGGAALMNGYSGLLNSSRVCKKAAAILNNNEFSAARLQNMVNAGQIYLSSVNTDSKYYSYRLSIVTVLDSYENVIDITNAMAEAFVSELNDLVGVGTFQVTNKASNYGISKSIINPLAVMVAFSVAMFVLSSLVIFVKEFFNQKVYLISQCEQNKDLILGLIPENLER